MRRSPHVIGIAAGASLACVLAGAATATAATSAKAAPPPSAAKSASPVIVILNNQSGNAATTESPVISQVKAAGGTSVIGYSAVASFAATVSPAEAATLAANPAVASVVPDQKINVTPPTASQVPASPAGPTTGGSTVVGHLRHRRQATAARGPDHDARQRGARGGHHRGGRDRGLDRRRPGPEQP